MSHEFWMLTSFTLNSRQCYLYSSIFFYSIFIRTSIIFTEQQYRNWQKHLFLLPAIRKKNSTNNNNMKEIYFYYDGSIFLNFNLRTRLLRAVKFKAPLDSWNIPLILFGTTGTSNTSGFAFVERLAFCCFSGSFLRFNSSKNRFSCRFHLKNSCDSWLIFHIVVAWHQVFQ